MCVGSMYTTTFFFNLVKSFLLSQMEPISDARLCDVTFITLQKNSVWNKCCSFELSIYQSILKKVQYYGFDKNVKQHNV